MADNDPNRLRLLLLEKERRSRQTQNAPKPQGLMSKGWQLLGKPEEMSTQGLGQLASFIPEGKITGNMPADIARGTPRILANTLAQAAPGFVSKGALLTAGAAPALRGLGAAAKVVGPGIASQLESLSGMKPGLLTDAYKDLTLLFARIPPEAREAYQRFAEFASKTSKEVAETPRPFQLMMKLLAKAKTGMIGQDEALSGRKAVDQLWESRTITEDFKNTARKAFDVIAKTAPDIREADVGFSRGMKAAGLRQLFPQNKYGGTSAFKTAIMAALNSMGAAGKVGMAALSPLAMGTGATALGALSRPLGALASNPEAAVALQQLINALISRKQQQPQGSGIQ